MKSGSSLHELGQLLKSGSSLHELGQLHLQFGQLDKPCADVMMDESAKSYQAENPRQGGSLSGLKLSIIFLV